MRYCLVVGNYIRGGYKWLVCYSGHMDEIDRDARVIWDYLVMHQDLRPADALFVLCSYDTRVAERAVDLYHQGFGKFVIISGGISPTSTRSFGSSEADYFANILVRHGVPKDKIIIEDRSTNTGQNIQFTYALLEKLGKHFDSLLLVQKPYMERRTYATFCKQWPDAATVFQITSPLISYDDYFNEENPKEKVLNTLTGDMQRIREYPALGFQIPQEIPKEVWAAYERMVSAGFTRRVI